MQFIGQPLPVHQFVTVPWDFNPVPYCQPSSPTPMEYTTSIDFGLACLAGSEVNIQQENTHDTFALVTQEIWPICIIFIWFGFMAYQLMLVIQCVK